MTARYHHSVLFIALLTQAFISPLAEWVHTASPDIHLRGEKHHAIASPDACAACAFVRVRVSDSPQVSLLHEGLRVVERTALPRVLSEFAKVILLSDSRGPPPL